MTELEILQKEVAELRQLVIDADEVARLRGDKFGLCDSVANDGSPYLSQWASDIVERLRSDGMPTITARDALFWRLVSEQGNV